MDRYTEIRSFSLVAEGSFAGAALVEGVTHCRYGTALGYPRIAPGRSAYASLDKRSHADSTGGTIF